LGPETNVPDLAPYSLDGPGPGTRADTKAVGLELLDDAKREPLRGSEAAQNLGRRLLCPRGQGNGSFWIFSVTSSACANSATPTPLPIVRRPHAAWSFPIFPRSSWANCSRASERQRSGMRAGPSAQNADPALENETFRSAASMLIKQPIRYTFCAVI